MRGGYTARITGRPIGVVQDIEPVDTLSVDLTCRGLVYEPLVKDGQRVTVGSPLAVARLAGGETMLPAPATGTVRIVAERLPPRVVLENVNPRTPPLRPVDLHRLTAGNLRDALTGLGVWPFIWSSRTRGIPCPDGSERPRTIVVNCVTAEPFRARGNVILRRDWARIMQGLSALPRLTEEYGTILVTLTEASSPTVHLMRKDLAGLAWIRFEHVPLRYPVEHPLVLYRALRRMLPPQSRDGTVWVTDVQTVLCLGRGLANGFAVPERVVAIGGPGEPNPRHVCARVGTPLTKIMDRAAASAQNLILRGGLFTGEPVDWTQDAIRADDDAFFVLPRPRHREFMSFVRAGFDRRSALPVFASCLTGAPDRNMTTNLRGEKRPCIGCGICEGVCPAGLLPQVLHQCLYREDFEEAESLGLHHCIRCGLCAYVCPSKLDLRHEFTVAQDRVLKERAEVAAATAAREGSEKSLEIGRQKKDDWRT